MSEIFIKIHQGTGKLTGESLCRSCTYGLFNIDSKGEHTTCLYSQKVNPMGKVTECSYYYNKSLPSLQAMSQSAWTLRTEKDGRKIGFEAPKAGTQGIPESF